MGLPQIKPDTAVLLRRFALGRFVGTLVRDAESFGPITFLYALILAPRDSTGPPLIVTCERNTMQDQLIAAIADDLDVETRRSIEGRSPCFLCYFDTDDKHHNVEQLAIVPSPDEFLTRALSIARIQLGITGSPVPFADESGYVTPSSHSSMQSRPGLFKRFFGPAPKERSSNTSACPSPDDEEGFIRWTLLHGSDFTELLRTFFSERANAFVDIAVKYVLNELDTYAEPSALYDRFKKVAALYERDLIPLIVQAGGIRNLQSDQRFEMIEVYVRVVFLYRFVCHKCKLIPEPPYSTITRLPI